MPEIIGRFTINNGKIDAPPGFTGEYILEIAKGGSFTFKPIDKATIKDDLKFEVYNDETPDLIASFCNELQACNYKSEMERFFAKPYHMRKVFPSAGKNGKIVVEG